LPVSVIAAFALLDIGGYTLNVITLSALTIVIGLVVDDSIVVVDNIVRNMEHGKGARDAAAIGPAEVSGAVTAATLTNAAIFMPVLFVGGIIGVFFKELAYVVVVTLLASLAVSLLLVPALAQRLLQQPKAETWITVTGEHLFGRLERGYGRVIRWALRHRGRVVAVAMGSFALSLLVTRIVGMDFMPSADGSMLMVTAELPVGTSLEHTTSVGKSIEAILKRRIPEGTLFSVRAGASREALAALSGNRQGANVATVVCIVPEPRLRSRSTFEMAEAVRPEIAALPEIETLQLDGTNPVANVAMGGQRPLTLEVYSATNSITELRQAARRIRQIASEIEGAVDVGTDMIADNPELQVTIDRVAAARLGVPVAVVARATAAETRMSTSSCVCARKTGARSRTSRA
jgi:multidrug efflux pump subunit AcrB